MDIVVLLELCVPLLAGCFIGSRIAKGIGPLALASLVAPFSLLVSTARLTDRATVGRWHEPASWTQMYFLGLGCGAILLGFALGASVALVLVRFEKR